MHDFKCQRCGECCKRYYIVSTPEEIAGQASLMGMGLREFLDRHCQLYLQIFPYTQDEQKPVIAKSLLPKKIASALEREAITVPSHLVVLPMVCFQRAKDGNGNDDACTFYTEENGLGSCSIYSARPLECRLFPFISMDKNADYRKLYPFCHGLKFKDEKLEYADLSYTHFRQTSEYFREVMEKGFRAIWKEWPGKGVMLYKDRPLGGITEQEFMQAIAPYK